jgi:hypothetical protein
MVSERDGAYCVDLKTRAVRKLKRGFLKKPQSNAANPFGSHRLTRGESSLRFSG